MARQSSGSQSLIQEAQERRREWTERERSKSQESETHKDKGDELEDIKIKYELQNRSLAKNNALMSAKITEMENKISDLINDNVSLRLVGRNDYKEDLQEKLDELEDNIYKKVDEIFGILQDFRNREGLKQSRHHSGHGTRTSVRLSEEILGTPTPMALPSQIQGTMKTKHSKTEKSLLSQEILEVSEESMDIESSTSDEKQSKSPKTPKAHQENKLKETSRLQLNQAKTKTNEFNDTENNQENKRRGRKSDIMPTRRLSRRRSEIDYAEPSLNKKLRRDKVELIDAVTDGNYKRPLKNDRVALGVIDTNVNRKKSSKKDGDIFDLVDTPPTNRRYTMTN